MLGHVLERLGLQWRLERGLAGLDALDGLAGLLPRLVDGHQVGGADGRPDLFAAGGIAGDGDVTSCAARRHSDVVPGQHRIGMSVALGAQFEGCDAGVGERFSHVE